MSSFSCRLGLAFLLSAPAWADCPNATFERQALDKLAQQDFLSTVRNLVRDLNDLPPETPCLETRRAWLREHSQKAPPELKTSVELSRLWAEFYLREDPSLAQPYLEVVRLQNKDDLFVRYALAAQAQREKRPQDEVRYLRELVAQVAKTPTDTEYRRKGARRLFEVLRDLGDFRGALEASDNFLKTPLMTPEFLFARADLCVKTSDWKRLAVTTKEFPPEDQVDERRRSEATYYRGVLFQSQKDASAMESAKDMYRSYLLIMSRNKQRDLEVLQRLCAVSNALGDPKDLRRVAESGLKNFPQDEVLQNCHDESLRKGALAPGKERLTDLRRAADLNAEGKLIALRLAAELLLAADRLKADDPGRESLYEEADRRLSYFADKDPGALDVSIWLGRVNYRWKRYAKAHEFYRRALEALRRGEKPPRPLTPERVFEDAAANLRARGDKLEAQKLVEEARVRYRKKPR